MIPKYLTQYSRSWYNMAILFNKPDIMYNIYCKSIHSNNTEANEKKSINFYADWIFTPEPDLWPTFFVRAYNRPHTFMVAQPKCIQFSLLTFLHWFCFYQTIHIRFLFPYWCLYCWCHSHRCERLLSFLSLLFQFIWLIIIITNKRTIKWNVHSYMSLKRLYSSLSSLLYH